MDNTEQNLIAFGPVPSRRLGQSLGINNIPPKICTYCCVYCQLGRTIKVRFKRDGFYHPENLITRVKKKIHQSRQQNAPIDYLTFVPDGEPTLDINLGKEIKSLKSTGIKVAMITNASLLWKEDVRADLLNADWVSLKIDSTMNETWRKIDRAHRRLKLDNILAGITSFSSSFTGLLTTETMMIQGLNDTAGEINGIAGLISRIKPHKSYLAVPTRPPAEKWVHPASENTLHLAYQSFTKKGIKTEYLLGYEGNAFANTGNLEQDLLSITSVHPMREDAVEEYLARAKENWSFVKRLIQQKKLVEVFYGGKKFFLRKLSS
ncbi:MAG: radical SAM protein [Spirochaetota bacterium]